MNESQTSAGLHSEATEANWEVSDQVLWAVWNKTFGGFLRAGYRKDPITFSWLLASPGRKGWEEISGPRGFPGSLVAAFPLADLRAVSGVNDLLAKMGKLWPVADLVPSPGQLPLAIQGKTALDALIRKGETIVSKKDYAAIDGDVRPVVPGHDHDWLFEQVDPVNARRLKAYLAEAAE